MRVALSFVLAFISAIGFPSGSLAADESHLNRAPARNGSLQLGSPVLAPLAHVRFCLQYPQDCRQHTLFRGGPPDLDNQLQSELVRVNAEVNRSIIPQANAGGVLNERWLVAP